VPPKNKKRRGGQPGAKEELMIKYNIINYLRLVNLAVIAGLVFAAGVSC